MLFSLDSLLSIARDDRARLGRGAPTIESSGLVDIRTLGAMASTDARPSSPPAAAVPGFGGAGLVGLGTLVPTTPPRAVVMRAQRSDGPLVAMIGLLLLVVLGLGAYIVLDTPEPIVVTTPGAPAPDLSQMAERRDAAAAVIAREVDAEIDRPAVEEPPPAEPNAIVAKPTQTREPKPTVRKTERKPATPRVEAVKKDDVPIECVLDPKLAKCTGAKAAQAAPPPRSSDANLPLSLSQADIRSGVAPLKDTAKSCGVKHRAKPGEKVRVKLSIAGTTGKVASATPESPHAGTSLGNCVAATLKKASFSRFRKPVVGVVYAITM